MPHLPLLNLLKSFHLLWGSHGRSRGNLAEGVEIELYNFHIKSDAFEIKLNTFQIKTDIFLI